MDVYDSSIWLWGLLKDEPNTSRLIEDVVDGTRSVAISAYIHDEVTNGFKQVAQAGRIDVTDAQMKFNTTIANMDNVQFPDQTTRACAAVYKWPPEKAIKI